MTNPNPILYVMPQSEPVPSLNRHITRLAFRNRMTQTERVKFDLAGDRPVYKDDENATETRAQFQTRRANAAAFRDMNTQVSDAKYIDLDRPETRAGVQMLETVTLLGVGRALEILDAPIQPHERFTE